jgi:hypothetical protein
MICPNYLANGIYRRCFSVFLEAVQEIVFVPLHMEEGGVATIRLGESMVGGAWERRAVPCSTMARLGERNGAAEGKASTRQAER